ncbi:NAD(P)H-hydrate dehydratase [Dyadobacter sandarakinus]|uniref:Bifunctional NAD(P)H-hydrate repair enzyme n=1 Tax=Dyadobacter sandarakinus TaxID=2747268 RepID=A0ABX7I819_9BACT|nr:NAD(P)H-hydrate dehydratase [Dyadobacter sandarakinus]QRR01687.1 NAD(P)H-hydrate dehydratase [Dyadobacter sandarakinus]
MKIFNAQQIRDWDAYTIAHEPVSSLDLMERASQAFVKWFCNQFVQTRPVWVFCGKGNNGGDGLAIARILSTGGYDVQVYTIDYPGKASADYSANLERLKSHITPTQIAAITDFPEVPEQVVCIDALLGTGLSRPVEGLLSEIIVKLNSLTNKIVSVDIASGLYTDQSNAQDDVIVKPHFTVTFQCPKLSFMMPQNAHFTGSWHVVPIGLSEEYAQQTPASYYFTEKKAAETRIQPRQKFSHKGTFGHALLVAGSFGKMGAAVLSGKACLRSGAGLLTMHVPACGYEIMQISLPEAMTTVDKHEKINTQLPELDAYSAVGIGPGIGKEQPTVELVEKLLDTIGVPLLIDADALNILSENRQLLDKLPAKTILTPHPKEFQRLAGDSSNEFERLEAGRQFAIRHQVIICLKGANTAVILSNGDVHFNSTGNAGMATGGTGDVLSGIITSLLAQKYPAEDAAILGVYEHGLAGDRAAARRGQSALIASDVVEYLGW